MAAIEPKLQLAEIERMKRKPASSLAAYDLLLRAQQCNEFRMESHSQALRHLNRHSLSAVREVLNVEPELTLRGLRARLMFIEEKVWREYSSALRLAGLPE